ncbi:MAG: putative collagen-binding domain-containing protein, partial [Verrucomicrobiota bacterium]|nr:putative collagen-binding domain-containing protein [Verrucomicrobiota bacterium]
DAIANYVAASRSLDGSLVVVYTPVEARLKINVTKLPSPLIAAWLNPRTGERTDVLAVLRGSALECPAPGDGDWLLILRAKKSDSEASLLR